MLRDRIVKDMRNDCELQLHAFVERIQTTHENYVIWGAASSGQTVMSYFDTQSNHTLKQMYIVDNNPAMWDGETIVSPEKFAEIMDQVSVVLVCVYVADQVEKQLRKMGYRNEIVIANATFLTDKRYYQVFEGNMEHMEWIYETVADERSRDTLAAFLNFLRTGDVKMWNGVNGSSDEKLMDTSVLTFGSREHLVDVGAFIGDTMEQFLTNVGGSYQSIVLLEPDKHNFQQLSKRVQELGLHDVFLYNCAVGEKEGVTHFSAELSESCHINNDVNCKNTVRMVSLDCVPECANATYIKISTNGYEHDVIKGAKELIQRNRPKLSFYASNVQMWEIPRFLKELVPEYKIYIRHYGVASKAMIGYASV